jgi:hypothetical protein
MGRGALGLLREKIRAGVDRSPLVADINLLCHLPKSFYRCAIFFELPNPGRYGLKFSPVNNERDEVTINITLQVTRRCCMVAAHSTFVISRKHVVFLSQLDFRTEFVYPSPRKSTAFPVPASARASTCSCDIAKSSSPKKDTLVRQFRISNLRLRIADAFGPHRRHPADAVPGVDFAAGKGVGRGALVS